MTYYCTECKKYHSDKFYKHVKYKRDNETDEVFKMIDDLTESEPQAFTNSHEICGLEIKIDKLEKKLETIVGILIHWKMFIDRKHPYADAYQPLFEDLL